MESTGDEHAAQTGRPVAVRNCRVEAPPTRDLLAAIETPRLVWTDRSERIVAGGAAATVTADGSERFETVRQQATALFETVSVDSPEAARPRLYGGFAFTDAHTDPGGDATWAGFPGAQFVLPAIQVVEADPGAWLTTAATGADATQRAETRLDHWRDRLEELPAVESTGPPGISEKTYAPPRADWQREIQEATARIEQGHLQKVVLAQALTARLSEPVTPSDVLVRLGESYPDCFQFLFEPETGGSFFGATPERLVSVDGTTVETEALAGSIGRGETTEEDEWLASQLRDSDKNTHEHDIVVETILDQLAPFADDITTGARQIRKLANVQHLQTPIRADLGEEYHVLDLVEALHPTPAVGGLPPERALETIRETEVFDRGWYAAPVGWFDADGDGTFSVAIRSAVACERQATLFAGAGIVADSDPDQEYDELQLKYRPILDELV
ncbi:isochorismate synthase [Halovenus sp. WSH3]|uniref:isochorismate synthase n=1 Tax=Halovenus carboxidivorans TaxID=2692199 RepID=A0A6B0T0I9_9EURY|nr:isochorismate synthase [Halovenus carboxidivorans]MXR51345.1 isochorismate synthase [Halovenus carboxidivorans]